MNKRPKIEFYRSWWNKRWDWRWRLRAANGRIIGASSESYRRIGDCRKNAKQLGELLVELT